MNRQAATALVLIAGRGLRLGAHTPKCLVAVGGRPLLHHYLEALADRDIHRVRFVTGFGAASVVAAIDTSRFAGMIDFVHNPDFREGSVLSLLAGIQGITGPVLIMDGDVFFDHRVLHALLDHPAGNALAVDTSRSFTDEEYMAAMDATGRIHTLARSAVSGHSTGEWVGFARLDDAARTELERRVREQVAMGHTAGGYEDALAGLLPGTDVWCAPVNGIPWVEIDFPADLAEAERLAADPA